MIVSDHQYLRMKGLGVMNYYDLLAQANLQNCSPRDSACVANNTAKQAAVEDYWAANQANGVPDGTTINLPTLTSGQVTNFMNNTVAVLPVTVSQPGMTNSVVIGGVTQQPAKPITPTAIPPTVSMTTSRGTMQMVVGDSWTVIVTGPPGAAVSVKGGKSGATDTVAEGTIGSNGKYVLTGTVGTGEIGSWSETWYAGTTVAGALTFSVSAAPAPPPAGKPPAYVPPPGRTPTTQVPPGPPVTGGFVGDILVGVEALFSPSSWGAVFSSGKPGEILGLVGLPAAAVLLFLMSKGRH